MTSFTSSLRKQLSQDLSTLSGSSILSHHVLVTSPRKCTTIFPHSSLPQKRRAHITQQDYLILLTQSPFDASVEASLVSAIEIAVYAFPATQASIVYISKIDSTGQVVPDSGSPTAILVKSVLRFFTNLSTRPSPTVRLQLFARAQPQYLFPNSSEHPGKRVLRDVELCRWWKDVLTDVIETQADVAEWKPFYLFPGLSEIEALNMLKNVSARTRPDGPLKWVYGQPYSLPHSVTFSLEAGSTTSITTTIDIFDCIPAFADDPKARFLVELVATDKPGGDLKAPARKRLKARHPTPDSESKHSADDDEDHPRKKGIVAEEFWERMDFRQECSMGAVTGFFVVDFVASSPASGLPSEMESAPTGPTSGFIPSPVLNRITASLMNSDFGTTDRARQATHVLTDSIKGLCNSLSTDEDGQAVSSPDEFYTTHVATTIEVKNPPRQPTQSANDTPGTVAAPPPAVNVLQVRKKKRPATGS